jgi:hypothetical protein
MPQIYHGPPDSRRVARLFFSLLDIEHLSFKRMYPKSFGLFGLESPVADHYWWYARSDCLTLDEDTSVEDISYYLYFEN